MELGNYPLETQRMNNYNWNYKRAVSIYDTYTPVMNIIKPKKCEKQQQKTED